MAAELRLGVSFDLVYFRQQLDKLARITASEFTAPIKIRLDRRSIDAELNNLRRLIARRKYNVELNIAGGLSKETFDALQKRLDSLAKIQKIEIPVSVKNAATGRDAASVVTSIKRRLLETQEFRNGDGKLRIPVSVKSGITNADVADFRREVRAKLSGITVKVKADLQATAVAGGAKSQSQIDAEVKRGLQAISEMGAARMRGGDVSAAARRESLRQAISGTQTITEAKQIAKQLGISGYSSYKKSDLNKLIDKIVAEAAVDKIKEYLDPQMRMGADRGPLMRVLDTFARGFFAAFSMDPAQVRREMQARYRASLPQIDFPAVTPTRSIPIGPSGTGRLLSGGISPRELPGTSPFAQKQLLGDLLDPELKEILRGAANTFVDQIRSQLNSAVRTVSVRDLGASIRGALPPGATRTPIPALPSAGGTGGYFTGGRRPGGGYVPPGGFPSDGMAMGPQGPKNMLSLDYYRNAFKYAEALNVAQRSMANFRASQLPMVGGLREIAGEFGMATQQVLLYGTAYKGLAFITSLPGQMLNAAKSQQQYNNALQVATQQSGTYAKELLFLDNVQRAFGLSLQTTRDGFVRLYASMAPAGFDSGSIERLFTGISAATAALQLTPDKAERVIYAFGQMASKGQVMSEELKGQLGDVLPGALSIFSKAAGKSIQEFNQDLEKGVYKGEAFRSLMTKVTDELIDRFGTGAQAAGRSLQGLLSTVQGDFQRTMEAFSPMADAAAQAVLRPLGGALRQLTLSSQIAFGEIERIQGQLVAARQVVSDLKVGGGSDAQIRAAEQNVASLEARLNALNKAAQDPAIAKQAQDIQKFVQELAKAGTFVMNVAKTIGGILSPVLNVLGTNLTSVIATLSSLFIGFQAARLAAMALMGVLLAYRGLSAIMGLGTVAQQAGAVAAAFRLLGVSATGAQVQVVGLRVALTALVATTVVGAVVTGIVMIAGAFATMRDRAKEASQASRDAAKSAIEAASTGNVAMANMQVQTILSESRAAKTARETLQKIYARSSKEQRKGVAPMQLTPEEVIALKGSPLTAGIVESGTMRGGRREIRVPSQQEISGINAQFGSVAGQQAISLREAKAAQQEAVRVARETGQNVPTPGAPLPAAPGKPDEKALRAAQQMADDRRKYEADLMKMNANQAMELNQMEFDQWKSLQDAKFDYMEAGQNEWMKREIKFQRDLQAIEIRREEAIRRARQETQKASIEAQAKAYVAGSGGAYLQGNIGPTSTGPHFDVKKVGGGYFPRDYLDKYVQVNGRPLSAGTTVPGGTFAAHQRRNSHGWDYAFGAGRHAATLTGGAQWMEGVPTAHGEQRRFKLPTGEVFQFLHGRSEGIGGATGKPSARARTEQKQDLNAELAQREVINAKEREALAIKQANFLAQQQINVLVAEYVASIAPVEQQKLENSLLQDRIALIKEGKSGEELDLQLKTAEVTRRNSLAVEEATKKIAQYKEEIENKNRSAEDGARLIAIENQRIKELTDATAKYLPLLRQRTYLEREASFRQKLGDIGRRTDVVGQGLGAGFIGGSRQAYEGALLEGFTPDEAKALAEATQRMEMATMIAEGLENAATGIGDAFAQSFSSVLTGAESAKVALGNLFSNVGKMFADMAAKMLAQWMVMKAVGLVASLFPSASIVKGVDVPVAQMPAGMAFANGGIAPGGFHAFANGGMVTGPTLGLVGEGRFNEAVVPLPDGKSIPVDLGSGTGNDISTNIVVNVNNGQAQSNVSGSGGNQLAKQLDAAVKEVILRETRPGGIIYSSR